MRKAICIESGENTEKNEKDVLKKIESAMTQIKERQSIEMQLYQTKIINYVQK